MLDYDFICKVEEANLYKRFLPYAIGSPSRKFTPDNSYDRANFVFFTDSHIDFMEPDACMDNLKRTIAFSNESPIVFDAVINAGDAITPFFLQDKTLPLTYFKQFFDEAKKSRSPFIFSKGNHDCNCWWNKPENVLTDSDYSNLFYWFSEENYGTVHQCKANGYRSTWNYYDVEKQKIRIISVDMQDIDKTVTNEKGEVKYFSGDGRRYISNEQMNWIANVALNFDDKAEKDWGVIIVGHDCKGKHPDFENIGEKLLDLCVAFNNGDIYEHHYKNEVNSFFDLDVKADYTRYKDLDKKPHMICWLLGHIHDDIHEVQKGIHIIYTRNASASMRSGDSRVLRLPGTVTQNAFDVVNIDTRTRKIRMFRYGAGVNCYGEGGDRFLPDGLSY